jgi:hypothetical protein
MSCTSVSRAISTATNYSRSNSAHGYSALSKRYASTAVKRTGSLRSLPPHKMRALVALYHKSDTFITPESLDSAIDAAFTQQRQSTYRNLGKDMSLRELWADVDRRRILPKEIPAIEMGKNRAGARSQDRMSRTSRNWSESGGSSREERVMAALFGVAEGLNEPGYELLRDKTKATLQVLDPDGQTKSS